MTLAEAKVNFEMIVVVAFYCFFLSLIFVVVLKHHKLEWKFGLRIISSSNWWMWIASQADAIIANLRTTTMNNQDKDEEPTILVAADTVCFDFASFFVSFLSLTEIYILITLKGGTASIPPWKLERAGSRQEGRARDRKKVKNWVSGVVGWEY